MSDYISRQAAIRWVKTECNPYGKPTLDFESGKKVIEHLEQMPTIDAVPVVRCRDCKYSDAEELNISSQQGHMEKRYIRFCKCDSHILVVADMHFCSCGERKDDV